MLLAVVACVLGLAVVLYALYQDEPLVPAGPAAPEWDPLPTPSDVVRSEFRLAYPGYDPASVETHLDVLRRAYADLYAVAPQEVLERARRRAELRTGAERGRAPQPPRQDPAPLDDDEGGEDELRLEIALATVDPPVQSDDVR